MGKTYCTKLFFVKNLLIDYNISNLICKGFETIFFKNDTLLCELRILRFHKCFNK